MPVDWTCESIRLSLFSTEAVRVVADDWKTLHRPDGGGAGTKGGRGQYTRVILSADSSASVGLPTGASSQSHYQSGRNLRRQRPLRRPLAYCFRSFQRATETYREGPLSRHPYGICGCSFAPTESSLDAYRALVAQVKSINGPEEQLHDLVFRINWPQNSTADNTLTLNRLTTWQVQQVQLQVVVPDGNSPGPRS